MKRVYILILSILLLLFLKCVKLPKTDNNEEMIERKQVIIAVLDDGINIDHLLLEENIYTNIYEIPNNGVDDDKNGYIDDYHGWNFVDDSFKLFKNEQYDYHGTAMAGIIVSNRKINTNLVLPLKIYGETPAKIENIIKAINYAEKAGAKICNLSWGSASRLDYLQLHEVIDNSDMLFVIAAGNDGMDNDVIQDLPSSLNCSNILSVTTVNSDGKLWTWGNYGKESVDIAVEGIEIECISSTNEIGKLFQIYSGTSISAAIASRDAGIMLSEYSLTALEVKDRLIDMAVKNNNLDNYIKHGCYLQY